MLNRLGFAITLGVYPGRQNKGSRRTHPISQLTKGAPPHEWLPPTKAKPSVTVSRPLLWGDTTHNFLWKCGLRPSVVPLDLYFVEPSCPICKALEGRFAEKILSVPCALIPVCRELTRTCPSRPSSSQTCNTDSAASPSTISASPIPRLQDRKTKVQSPCRKRKEKGKRENTDPIQRALTRSRKARN